MRPLVAALLLLLPGCVTLGPAATAPEGPGSLSEALFDRVLAEALPFSAEDGAVIDMWVYRPEGATGVPIIINFSPYWSNLAPPTATGGDAFSLYLIDHFVPRGYAVVLASARGTGLSEGCFTIGGTREIDDMVQIADHLAGQEWTNGNLAAVAKSYDGTMAQGLLTRDHPALKTIVPVSPISEFYKYNYHGGVPYDFGGLLFNTYYVAETSLFQGIDPFSRTVEPDPVTYERTPTRFCDEAVEVQSAQYHGAATGDYSAYWQERNYTALLPPEVTASVFYIHGLQDWNVKPDHMTPWLDELYARNVTVKAWLGQWGHDYPHRDDWNTTLLRWFDSELKGIDNGIRREPLVQVQDTEGIWRNEARWPPARASPTAFYTSADGALGREPGTGASTYGDAPAGAALRVPTTASVLFASQPLERDVRIVGSPVFTATVSSTSPRATLAVTLLLDGLIVDQGFLDLAHRNGLEASEPAMPGERYPITIPLFPQDIVIRAGSILSLMIASSAPEDAPAAVSPFSAPGIVTIEHGEGTALSLPLVEGGDVEVEARQPDDLGCWTC